MSIKINKDKNDVDSNCQLLGFIVFLIAKINKIGWFWIKLKTLNVLTNWYLIRCLIFLKANTYGIFLHLRQPEHVHSCPREHSCCCSRCTTSRSETLRAVHDKSQPEVKEKLNVAKGLLCFGVFKYLKKWFKNVFVFLITIQKEHSIFFLYLN